MDGTFLMQNRKFRLIGSILISKCSFRSNLENEYPHFMFLTTNNEVLWRLKWPGHCIIHVSAIVKLACPRVNEPYAHQSRACDSRNYRRVIVEITARRPMEGLHWKFMWGIIIYKYNILERVIVENIIPRNMIINRGPAEVDNHISRDDFSTITLS